MLKAGLNDEEQKLMEKYLLSVYGVAPSQELMMILSMDPHIAGFTVEEANKLRKGVAKKQKAVLEECKALFYSKGKALGTRQELLDYVWGVQIHRQEGYSFSDLHTTAYSTIALQEMNLNYHYDPIYWACACLNVNANAVNDGDYEFSRGRRAVHAILSAEQVNTAILHCSQVLQSVRSITGESGQLENQDISDIVFLSFDVSKHPVELGSVFGILARLALVAVFSNNINFL